MAKVNRLAFIIMFEDPQTKGIFFSTPKICEKGSQFVEVGTKYRQQERS